MPAVTLTLTFGNEAEAAAFLTRAPGAPGKPASTPTGPAPTKPAAASTPTGAPATPPAASPSPPASVEPAAADPNRVGTEEEYAASGLGPVIKGLVDTKGKAVALALLGKFGAAKGPLLKLKDYSKFKEMAEAEHLG